MHLTVLNGSPRGRAGNTAVILQAFLEGFSAVPGNSHDVQYLYDPQRGEGHPDFVTAETGNLLAAFPLYVDAMPSAVKYFIEGLEPLKGRLGHLRMGYIVHSGFPEPIHSRFVEKYLVRLTGRLGAEYVGTIVKGASEGLRGKTGRGKDLGVIRSTGEAFAKTGCFDEKCLVKLAPRDKLPSSVISLCKILDRLGILDRIWDRPLRENGAWERRYDRPYEPRENEPYERWD